MTDFDRLVRLIEKHGGMNMFRCQDGTWHPSAGLVGSPFPLKGSAREALLALIERDEKTEAERNRDDEHLEGMA